MARTCPCFTWLPRWTLKSVTVDVIFGEMTACCSGKTIASAVTTSEIGARCTAVVWTLTIGSFSFSALLQPANQQASPAAATVAARSHFLENWKLSRRVLMDSSALPSKFANSQAQHDNAQRHHDRRRSPGQTWFAHRQLPTP